MGESWAGVEVGGGSIHGGGGRHSGALADDDFAAEPFRGGTCAAKEFHHAVHCRRSETQLRLADGGQRHAEMFADENISEDDEREVIRDFQALTEEHIRRADRDEVVDGLDRGGARGLLEQLERCFFPFFNRAAGMKDQALIQFGWPR